MFCVCLPPETPCLQRGTLGEQNLGKPLVGQGGEEKGWNPPSACNSDGKEHRSRLGLGTQSAGQGSGLSLTGPEPAVVGPGCQGVLSSGAQVC